MAKFKVGDKIYFKADSYNRYQIDEVHEKDNYYVYYLDGKAHRMDMSYTDANFELQSSSKKEKELDIQEFAKEMSKSDMKDYPALKYNIMPAWIIIPTFIISKYSFHFAWLCLDLYFQWKAVTKK